MTERQRATVRHLTIIVPPGTSEEVNALARMIAVRAGSGANTPDEWRTIIRAAERIARIGRELVR